MFLLSGQKLLLVGINGGITYSYMTAIVTVEGIETRISKDIGEARGLAGYTAGAFLDYYVLPQVLLRGELSYEVLRFRSDNLGFDTGTIYHIKSGVLIGVKPITPVVLLGGVEIARRRNSSSVDGPLDGLNGLDVEGTYWQSIVEIAFELKNEMQLGFRMTVPRISSLTRTFINLTEREELVEQLRAFQLRIEVPILKN